VPTAFNEKNNKIKVVYIMIIIAWYRNDPNHHHIETARRFCQSQHSMHRESSHSSITFWDKA